MSLVSSERSKDIAGQPHTLTAESLQPHLARCGYGPSLLATGYDFGARRVAIAAFADTPHDSRSACVAALDAKPDVAADVASAQSLGAPVVFACHSGKLQWWKQTIGAPVRMGPPIEREHIPRFFDEHRNDFGPDTIFRAKTFRRLPGQTQLSFVDAGLMPFVERTEGERLSRLVETAFQDVEEELGRSLNNEDDVQNAIKATFWLLAAKTLRDKAVDGFKTTDLTNINDVFARVGRHYGVSDDVPPPGKAWHRATSRAAARIGKFDSLRNLSTESLAHVYENAMVTPEVRKANGTHSTPGALVDYMVWQLWPWIEQLPPESRHVFEPACGHAAFLVSALRTLRQWSGIADGTSRHEYLKKHLHGVEYDPFALEVARLSLTLADIPHGNTWDLKPADMFKGRALADGARKCGVLLANPPYERFTADERNQYAKAGVSLDAGTKACATLLLTVPHLKAGSCFGVVVPQGLLHSREARSLRRMLVEDFELCEIAVFEDKLFEKGDHEAAILLGRRRQSAAAPSPFWFRRVRNADIEAFRDRFAFSSEERVAAPGDSESVDLRIPELRAVWSYLADYPKLGSVASLGQGLFHKGETLPRGTWTIHDPPKTGDVRGYAHVTDDLAIAGLPKAVGINISPAAVDREVAGMPTGKPQVLLNYARVSRDLWRLKAVLDLRGLALTNRFIAVRPLADVNAMCLWALLNSPIANAFSYFQSGKRDILVGTMRRLPVPPWSPLHAHRIEQAAVRYRSLVTAPGPVFNADATPEGIRQALLEMDAAVLQAYNLPPRLEYQLLDRFRDVERKGVGCTFTGYYPPGFLSYLPLHLLVSGRFKHAQADATFDRFRPGRSAHIQAVLNAAADEE